jgi:hypothetical protein
MISGNVEILPPIFYTVFWQPFWKWQTSRKFWKCRMSPFSKWLPQYRTNSTLSDFNVISYVGRLWCPELIPDIEKFLTVAIFKMATQPFWKWRPVEIVQCRESIWDIIIYPHIKFGWYRKILNFCGIVAAILKMATGRDFSMSGEVEISYINVDNF